MYTTARHACNPPRVKQTTAWHARQHTARKPLHSTHIHHRKTYSTPHCMHVNAQHTDFCVAHTDTTALNALHQTARTPLNTTCTSPLNADTTAHGRQPHTARHVCHCSSNAPMQGAFATARNTHHCMVDTPLQGLSSPMWNAHRHAAPPLLCRMTPQGMHAKS